MSTDGVWVVFNASSHYYFLADRIFQTEAEARACADPKWDQVAFVPWGVNAQEAAINALLTDRVHGQ